VVAQFIAADELFRALCEISQDFEFFGREVEALPPDVPPPQLLSPMIKGEVDFRAMENDRFFHQAILYRNRLPTSAAMTLVTVIISRARPARRTVIRSHSAKFSSFIV
jgi:hypothetical protein